MAISQVKAPVKPEISIIENGITILRASPRGGLIDSAGNLWCVGYGNLVKYNGGEFENYVMRNSMKNGGHIHIFEDYFKRKWTVSYNGYLSYLEDDVMHPYKYNDSVRKLIFAQNFMSLEFDKDSILHIGTAGDGYIKVYPNGTSEKLEGVFSNYFGVIALEREGRNPFLFSNGIKNREDQLYTFNYINNQGNLAYRFPIELPQIKYKSSLVKISDGSYLYSTGANALVHFSHKELLKHIKYPHKIIHLFVDKDEHIWIGTSTNGVHYYNSINDLDKEPIVYFPKESSAILGEGHNGEIFIKSGKKGLAYIYNQQVKFINQDSGLNSNSKIQAAEVTSKFAFVAAKSEIFKIERNGSIMELPTIPIFNEPREPTMLLSLCYDSLHDRLWAGGMQFIYYYENGQWRSNKTLKDIGKLGHIQSIIMLNDKKTICVAVGNHIVKVRNDSIIYNKRISEQAIIATITDDQDRIWIGAIDGLYTIPDDISKNHKAQNTTFNKRVDDLYYSDGKVWLIIDNHLANIDENNKFNSFFDIKGRHIFPDPEMGYWLVGYNGNLMRYKLDGNDSLHIDSFNGSMTTSASKRKTGFVWGDSLLIGTRRGLGIVDINNLKPFSDAPSVNFERVLVNSVDQPIRDHYELKYDENFLRINYSAIHYQRGPRPLGFTYKMEGLKDEWFSTKESSVQYTSLDPGHYTFILKADLGSLAISEPVKISFTITPPFWQTWWFRSLMVLLGIGLITLFIRYRLRSQKRKAQLVIDKLLAEQKALRAQMNPHFIFNSLSSIQQLVYDNEKIFAATNISIFAKLMRQVLEFSQKEKITLREELEMLHLYLQLEALRFEDSFTYGINVADEIDEESLYIPPLILQPIVENAIKHGLLKRDLPGGSVSIDIIRKGKELVIEITDDGIGRTAASSFQVDYDKAHRSFGLQALYSRIDLLNSTQELNMQLTIEDIEKDQKVSGTKAIVSLDIK